MRAALLIGALGLAASVLAWVVEPHRFYAGWLSAMTLLAGWTLGSLALLMAQPLTGGRWGEAVRPALLAGVSAMPLLLPAAVVLAIGLPDLYPWAKDGAHPANAFYLNVPFFAARGVFYLVVWLGMGALVLRGRGVAAFAPPALFLLGVTVSFAAIDTTMSLEPDFTSSIYGMMAACGMVLLAMSVAILISAPGASPELRADLGKLLLALVILFIYLDFMQLLIMWQSDLPPESQWYLDRTRGFWGALRVVIALGHFALPFALLLSGRMQRSRAVLLSVAGLLVATEVLRAWWTVLPSLKLQVGWADVATLAGVAGVALGVGGWARRRPAFVRRARHV